MLASHIRVLVQVLDTAPLLIQLPVNGLGCHQMITQDLLGPLQQTWETQMEFQIPSFSLNRPQQLQPLREWTSIWKISFSLPSKCIHNTNIPASCPSGFLLWPSWSLVTLLRLTSQVNDPPHWGNVAHCLIAEKWLYLSFSSMILGTCSELHGSIDG